MKKFFLSIFLVLSPLIFSQNNFDPNIEDLENNPVFKGQNFIEFSKDLAILGKYRTDPDDDKWIVNPENTLSDDPEKEFSSLLLIEQLNELNYKTPFQIEHNPTLERYIRVYLKNQKEKISNLMGRSRYYFPMFEEKLDKYDLPLELKYLAIVESALKPTASSPAGAKGLWQFMYPTGKQFDLQVDSYIDDRFDPLKSTEAACKYLSSLYLTFKDWDLALAAYNSGSGNVNKAIKRSGGKRNYWEIRQFLPRETRGYLPAFYAILYIFETANSHGLKPDLSGFSYMEIDTVHIKDQLSFLSIQNNLSIEKSILKELNPQYKKEIIPYSKNSENILTLPKNLIPDFLEREMHIYQNSSQKNKLYKPGAHIKVTRSNSYIVKPGDNLNSIATKHHISLAQLKKWNGLQTNYLISGQRLVISDMRTTPFFPKVSPDSPSPSHPKYKKTLTEANNIETYIVKQGDTLFTISKKYSNITINQLRNWNDIWDVNHLIPGTKLKIIKS